MVIARDTLVTAVELASIYGLVVLAVVVAFRISNFADLTMDGSFALGAAVGAVSISQGCSPFVALVLGLSAGGIAGIGTGLLHTRIGINRLLAGIIMMTMLYTFNLRVMGRSNIPMLDKPSVFDQLPDGLWEIVAVGTVGVIVSGVLWLFLLTDLGHFMRAAGENPRVVLRQGFTEEGFLLLGLCIANGLAGFAGGLAAQHHGFADIGMGTGIVIGSLTAVLLGEAILPPRTIPRLVLAALIGALAYQLLVGVGLRLGLNPWDLKLATGLLLIAALAFRHYLPFERAAANIGSDPL